MEKIVVTGIAVFIISIVLLNLLNIGEFVCYLNDSNCKLQELLDRFAKAGFKAKLDTDNFIHLNTGDYKIVLYCKRGSPYKVISRKISIRYLNKEGKTKQELKDGLKKLYQQLDNIINA